MAIFGGEAGGGGRSCGFRGLEEGDGLGEEGQAGARGEDESLAFEVELKVEVRGDQVGMPVAARGAIVTQVFESQAEGSGFAMEGEGVDAFCYCNRVSLATVKGGFISNANKLRKSCNE